MNDFNTKSPNQKTNYNTRLSGKSLSFWGEFSLKLSQKIIRIYLYVYGYFLNPKNLKLLFNFIILSIAIKN